MADVRLTAFIEQALRNGASREDVEKALKDAGWAQNQISDGLAQYADIAFVVPVPRPKAQLSARDAFMYLLMFATLYLSAYNFGRLLFQFIDLAFPDPLRGPPPALIRNTIRFATAALIVAFPLFLLIASRIAREVRAAPARRGSAVRKWLTYLTLFIAASVIVGDCITLIYNFLIGELTVRIILKVFVIALIAGVIFGYYLRLMKVDDEALER